MTSKKFVDGMAIVGMGVRVMGMNVTIERTIIIINVNPGTRYSEQSDG